MRYIYIVVLVLVLLGILLLRVLAIIIIENQLLSIDQKATGCIIINLGFIVN